jgi:hypothetical protein
MKSITTSESFRKADSSLDATLNPVELPSKEIVSWAVAFPRPGTDARSADGTDPNCGLSGGQGLAT